MKLNLLAFFFLFLLSASFRLQAQCSGSNNCSLNWDYLRFFPSAGIGSYTNLATSQSQRFAFGTQVLTIVHNYTGSNAVGEDATNTAETGAFGSGSDVHFVGDGVITVSFQNPVTNVRFSLFDIDYGQKVAVSTAAGNQVSMATLSGSVLSVTGNNTTTAQATATTTAVANSNTDGTVNITVSGTVSSFTITVSNTGTRTIGPASGREGGDFWLSDIAACSAGNFSPNYYAVSKPFVGQPAYVLMAHDNDVYYVNPATGAAKLLFTDPENSYFNSVAYDPVKKYVYYTFTRSGPGGSINASDKKVKRYDYNMDTLGVFMADASNYMPVFENGVESAAAAFYDSSLYLGIEASSSGSNKSVIWRVDLNSNDRPDTVSQVFAISGSTHDWSDIGIAAGMLYDFDGRSSKYYHQNLLTKAVTTYTAASSAAPRQTSVDWANTIYNAGAPSTGSSAIIVPYQQDGTVNTSLQKTITYNGTTAIGDWGDAGEAFKPKLDFGDAPVSYDSFADDSAVHELDTALYLGTKVDIEWTSHGHSSFASDDNYDDGLSGGALLNPASGDFLVQVKFYNNTGSPATICAWIDFDKNGTFDASEGIVVANLPSSSSSQNAYLYWTNINSVIPNGSNTYIRIRITSAANDMTANDATGYFSNGEVEDYWLPVATATLATELVSFTAVRNEDHFVKVNWKVVNAERKTVYVLQRSADGEHWEDLTQVKALSNGVASVGGAEASYDYIDFNPLKGSSYYRLRLKAKKESYSQVRKVESEEAFHVKLFPNPAASKATIVINVEAPCNGQIVLSSASGQQVYRQNVQLRNGANAVELCCLDQLVNGTYSLLVQACDKTYTQQLLIKK